MFILSKKENILYITELPEVSLHTQRKPVRQTEKPLQSQCSEVAFCDPCHFQTASGKSVALAASRAVAIGTQFKEPPPNHLKDVEGGGGLEDAKTQQCGISA